VRGQPGEALGVDGFEAGTVRGQAWWRSLSLRWFLHRHAKEMPGAAFETLLGDPRSQQTDTRGFVELRAEPELAPGVTLMSRLHHDHYVFRGQYPRDAIDAGVEVDTYRGQWMGLEERLVFRLTESWRFTVGGEGQVHYRVEQRAFDDEGYYLDQSGADAKPYQVGAAYAVTDADLAEWMRASLGARLDAYSTFGTSLNPRVAVILRPYAQGNTKLIGGKAFRAPSIYELYYNDDGYTQIESPDLKPESIYSAEIEHTHRFSPTVAGSVSGYANYVSDLVDSGGAGDETDPIYYFNSDTPLMVVGTEATMRRDWRQGWMVSASYGLSHAQFLRGQSASDVLGLRRDSEHRQVSNVPQHSATFKGAVPILARRMTAATRLTVEGTRWDRYEAVGDPAQERSDAHVLWDVVLSAHEERWGLDYALGVYNLFDWEYGLPIGNEYRQRTMPQRGRTFLASVDVRL